MSEPQPDNRHTGSESAPPAPPREVTRRGKLRSWAEPGVRLWWLLAAALLLVTGYVLARELAAVWSDRQLIKRGARVAASIEQFYINDQPSHPGQTVTADDNADYVLVFATPDGRPHKVRGHLKDQRMPLGRGMAVSIFYDPRDPNRWTDRQEVSWGAVFLLSFILLPVAGVLLLVALLRRGQVLALWRTGQAAIAIVVESRTAPIAPLSRALRMHLLESDDPRLFSVLVPARFASPSPGDTLWVITPRDGPETAIVAALYD